MTTPSLSQGEARRRAELLAVERYDLAVDLTGLPAGPEFRCVATVTFTCREPGARTFVDCAARVLAAALMRGTGRAVMEERLLDLLLADIRAA